MSILSRDRENKELGAIGGKKPISRQVSSSSRSSSVALMERLVKTFTEHMQQHQEQMRQQHLEFMEGLRKPSLDLNPVELRTNPSDGNFAFHAVPPQVTAPLISTPPSITSKT